MQRPRQVLAACWRGWILPLAKSQGGSACRRAWRLLEDFPALSMMGFGVGAVQHIGRLFDYFRCSSCSANF